MGDPRKIYSKVAEKHVCVKFKRVSGFSKRKFADNQVDGMYLRSYMKNSHEAVECPVGADTIPAMLKYDDVRSIIKSDQEEANVCESLLESHVICCCEQLAHTGLVDMIVVSVYDTVITVVGKKISCVSIYCIAGYSNAPKVRKVSEEFPPRGTYLVCAQCSEIFEYDIFIQGHMKCPDCPPHVGVMRSFDNYKDALEYSRSKFNESDT